VNDAVTARRCFVSGVGVLLGFNVARGLDWFDGFSGAATLALVAVFVVLARVGRLGPADLGLARADAGRGAGYGMAAFAVVAAVLVLVALVPATSDFLDDARADVSGGRLVFEILVPIALLTAVPEEFAFRGVLLASGTRWLGVRRSVLVTSVLFGLWHISPTLRTATQNAELDGATATAAGTAAVVAVNVLATFAGGLGFAWLRLRSRSLVAPVLAHIATNGVALVVAWCVVR
jgi:membrane protease YdiL (CAAX protease family)